MDSPEERALMRELANFLQVAADCLPRLTAALELLAGVPPTSLDALVTKKLSGLTATNAKERLALRRVRSALMHEANAGWVTLDDFEIARPDLERLRTIGPKNAELLVQMRRKHDEGKRVRRDVEIEA